MLATMLERARKAREDESGFTLIELLIVIVILGILAGIVVFAVGGITDKGTAAACKSDLKTVEVASEAYYAATTLGNGNYALDMPALVAAKLLREAPSTTHGYTITYNSTTGAVTGNVGTGTTGDCS
jgi:prepilin-type N-terminal cleavage/methylation domain-containing protein